MSSSPRTIKGTTSPNQCQSQFPGAVDTGNTSSPDHKAQPPQPARPNTLSMRHQQPADPPARSPAAALGEADPAQPPVERVEGSERRSTGASEAGRRARHTAGLTRIRGHAQPEGPRLEAKNPLLIITSWRSPAGRDLDLGSFANSGCRAAWSSPAPR